MKKYFTSRVQLLFTIQFVVFWVFQTTIIMLWWHEKIGFGESLGISLGTAMILNLEPIIFFFIGQMVWLELQIKKEFAERKLEESQAKRRDSIPPPMRVFIIERDNQTCTYCNRHGEHDVDPDGNPWHIDHVVPQSRGGPTHLENLTLSCSYCNLSKGSKSAVGYLLEMKNDTRPTNRIAMNNDTHHNAV